MKNISLNIDKVLGTVSKQQILAQETKANECIATLHNGNGKGSDFLGWLHLPTSITEEEVIELASHQAIVDAIQAGDGPQALIACQALLNAPHIRAVV